MNAKLVYMPETFKQRMKRLRLRAGYSSQAAAAEAIGCERGTVGMWEAPSSNVESVEGYLLDVARAYKVRPDYINSGEGEDAYPWPPTLSAESQPGGRDMGKMAHAVELLRWAAEIRARVGLAPFTAAKEAE
ncbi:MAG: helix-turn-helix transcriptional regulator, partial [Luteimonas sp.]